MTRQVGEAVQAERIRADVMAISGPRNRLYHSGAEQFESLIQASFSEAGWNTERNPFRYENASQVLEYASDGQASMTDGKDLYGVNVIARLDGIQPGPPVVIGAHYDTVPNSPGADDNGSGVAALLELARVLKPMPVRVPVILAAFDHEEAGMFGSRAFVDTMTSAGGVRLAVIYECIGYSDGKPGAQWIPAGIGALYRGQVRKMRRRGLVGDETIVIYQGSSAFAARYLGEHLSHLADRDRVVLLRNPVDLPAIGRLIRRGIPWASDFARSDHVPFWHASLPAVQITDTANLRNPHYHKASDTPEKLDYDRIADVVTATAILILRMGHP
jgi:Zn-dependent M28 family amino/carboxypeptidase